MPVTPTQEYDIVGLEQAPGIFEMRVPQGLVLPARLQELFIQQMVMNATVPGTGLRAGAPAVNRALFCCLGLCISSAPLIASLRGPPREDLDY